jgi:AraC-like DNA-binding protein
MTDALTLSLSRIALQAMIAGRSTLSAPWGFCVPIGRDGRPLMPHGPAAVFMPKLRAPCGCLYIILSGDCLFESEFGSERLSTGDLLFMTVSATHQLRDCATSPAPPIWDLAPPPVFAASVTAARSRGPSGLHVAGDGPETQLLQVILFSSDDVVLADERFPPLLHIASGAARTPDWVPTLVRAVVSESERSVAGSASVVTRMIQTLLDLAIMLDREERPAVATPAAKQLEGVIMAMELHPERQWRVAGLARMVGMSRTAFALSFAAEIGTPPMRYLARRRMERARCMLQSSDASIKSIALALGYASEPAFYAAFRASHGMTPATFRARQRDGGGEPEPDARSFQPAGTAPGLQQPGATSLRL